MDRKEKKNRINRKKQKERIILFFFFFFFQAEDGIRDLYLTGVHFFFSSRRRHTRSLRDWSSDVCSSDLRARMPGSSRTYRERSAASRRGSGRRRRRRRSEERRVGKECRSRWSPYH